MKKKILILNGWFLPGFKGGGPVQSINNLIQNLKDKFDFYVVCGDRDLKDKKSYDNVKINEWNKLYNANIYYMSPDKQNFKGMKELLNSFDYDVVYLNNYFNFKFTIIPLLLKRFKKVRNATYILSVRGDFTGGCNNKKIKKYTFMFIANILGIYKNILWHVTSDIENRDTLKKYPKAKTIIIPNLKEKYEEKKITQKKQKGILKMVYISRIFPKKNIKYALNVLRSVKDVEVTYDIYGSMEDEKYWSECQSIIEKLPKNIHAKYCGELPHELISETYQKYHAFFFPTNGENFGHVIVEAMMNNCPCIMSQGVTPWDDYIKKMGVGAPLQDEKKFVDDIKYIANMSQEEFIKFVNINNDFVKENLVDDNYAEAYFKMFNIEKGVERWNS